MTISRIREWFNKSVNMKTFLVLFIPMFVFYLLYLMSFVIFRSMDMYFIIATGREILENGIPYTNVWIIDSDVKFVAQQWLYAVILALVDKVGYFGLMGFVVLELFGFFMISYRFFSQKNINKSFRVIGFCVAVFLTQLYVFSLRPELMTLILIMIECVSLERYRDSSNWKWLLLLPATMLIEINVHASMWPIHYAVVLAYVIPSFYFPGSVKNDLRTKWKEISVASVAMTLVMFANPYGFDSILYIIRSYMDKTFNYVDIREVMETTFLSCEGVTILVTLALLFLCHHFKVISSVSVNMTMGFTFMAIMSQRNNMFLAIAILFLWRDLLSTQLSFDKSIDWRKDLTRTTASVLIMADIFFGIFAISNCPFLFIDYKDFMQSNSFFVMARYIKEKESSIDDIRVFTGMEAGVCLEYAGFKNVYIDTRPEIYTDSYAGDKNILADYSRYAYWGFTVPNVTNGWRYPPVTDDEMQAWLNSYDFDYMIICVESENYLAGYMASNSNYELVEEVCSPQFLLYERAY